MYGPRRNRRARRPPPSQSRSRLMTTQPAPAVPPRHFAFRMWVFFFGYFIVGGVVQPFFPLWLESRGLTAVEIGNCIAFPILVRVLLTPFAGVFADRAPNRRFVICIFVVTGTIAFAFAGPAHGYWPILLTTGAGFVLWGLGLPVAEALTLTGVRRFGLDYGRMRLGGSVSFIIANLASGALLGIVAPDAIFWMILAALGGAIAVSFTLPVTPRAVRALDDASQGPRPSAWAVLARPGLIALFVVGGLVQASHAVLYSFGSIYWKSLGYDGVDIGGFWAISIVFEVTLFIWSGLAVRTFGPFGLLLIGTLAAIVRWALFPLDMGPAGFAALQALHALTFAAAYLGTQHLIARSIPEELTASAQGIFGMMSGILLATSTAFAGPLYHSFGGDAYFFMTAPACVALVILVVHRLSGAERA
ncbi:MAG: MFS transporter [Bauldia sp.]